MDESRDRQTDQDPARPMDRRHFWRRVLGSALRGPAACTPAPEGPVRPPGALAESEFLARCAPGCRLCVDACPVACVIPSYDSGQPGGGDGRPFLLPDRVACVQCGLCQPACPTGALREDPRPAVSGQR